jgi:hypothetical protein
MASYPANRKDMCFAWPVLAGREEDWRRFLQALEGSRSEEYKRMKRRLGIGRTRTWLQRNRDYTMAVTCVKVDDPAAAVSALAASNEPFDRWFRNKIEEFHGVDIAHVGPFANAELVFSSDP